MDPNAPEGKESYLWVKPAAYLEDWDKIKEQVIDATYELDDDTGRKMTVKMTLFDSGGEAGEEGRDGTKSVVTTNAYNFWRKMRDEGFAPRLHRCMKSGVEGQRVLILVYPSG